MGTDRPGQQEEIIIKNGQEVHELAPLAPHNVIDKVILGRRLRALRILSGFDRATELTAILRSKYGIDISDRTVYAIERGEQMPHIDFYIAALDLMKPEGGTLYFLPAIRGDVSERMRGDDSLRLQP